MDRRSRSSPTPGRSPILASPSTSEPGRGSRDRQAWGRDGCSRCADGGLDGRSSASCLRRNGSHSVHRWVDAGTRGRLRGRCRGHNRCRLLRGAMAAAWTGLGLANDEACPEKMTELPVGLVLEESQFLFHHPRWDPAFISGDPEPKATLDGLFNPQRWNVSPDLRVALGRQSTRSPKPVRLRTRQATTRGSGCGRQRPRLSMTSSLWEHLTTSESTGRTMHCSWNLA